jgi:surface antigen
VWYVRGRAQEKLGITLGSMGNGNQMYTNAKKDAQLAPTVDNLKPDLIVSYGKGTSSAGQKYGHVIYIEDVVGDTVYYTEGGSGYYKNGTDGVVKTATRQGILDGVNSNGSRMGSEIKGFVDVSKYK